MYTIEMLSLYNRLSVFSFACLGLLFLYIYTRFTLNNQWNIQFKILHSEYKVPGVISLCTYVISCNLNVYTYLETMIIKY